MHVSATARRYARSLASVAIERDLVERVGAEMAGLRGFFEATPLARLTLESPDATSEQKAGLLKQIGEAVDFSEIVRNFLGVIVAENRFHLFSEMVAGFQSEIDKHQGVVEVHVTTAQPLSDGARDALRSTLEKNVTQGRTVRFEADVDSELLGGAVVRIGSVVYDGSLVNQLTQLRHQLIAE